MRNRGRGGRWPYAASNGLDLEPDIITLDISMPELNGVDAARKLKKILPRHPADLCDDARRSALRELSLQGRRFRLFAQTIRRVRITSSHSISHGWTMLCHPLGSERSRGVGHQ